MIGRGRRGHLALNPQRTSPYFAESLLAFNTVIWGGTYVAIKLGLADVAPYTLVALRYAFAATICAGPVLLYRVWLRPHVRDGFVLGVFLFLGIGLQTQGLLYTTAAKSSFITGMFIVFTPFLHWLLNGRRPRPENYAGILLVLLGLFLLTWPAENRFNLGDLLTILSALGFSLYIVHVDRVARAENTLALVFLQMATTALLGTVAAFALGESYVSPGSRATWALLYLALPGTLLMVFIQTRYQPRSNPIRAAIIYSLEPVFAALFAWILLGETLGARGLMGAGLMLGGVLLSETYRALSARIPTE